MEVTRCFGYLSHAFVSLITAAWEFTVFEAQGGVPATTTEETEDKLDLLEA